MLAALLMVVLVEELGPWWCGGVEAVVAWGFRDTVSTDAWCWSHLSGGSCMSHSGIGYSRTGGVGSTACGATNSTSLGVAMSPLLYQGQAHGQDLPSQPLGTFSQSQLPAGRCCSHSLSAILDSP